MQSIDPGRPTWPDGRQSCVALAFDLDGPTGGAMLDGSLWHNPSLFMLGAYEPWRALGYLLGLLRELRTPATFFVPAWVLDTWPKQCRAIVEDGHEVAYHGDQHEAFWQLDAGQQREVMARSKAVFARHLGLAPTGFRTPSGDWGPDTVDILLEAGVRYSSSMRGDDRPYFIPGTDGARGLVEIPGRWEMDDYTSLAYQRRPDYPAGLDRIAGYDNTLDNWRREFDGAHAEGLCLTTLLHPKVSCKPGRLGILERLIGHMRDQGNVWFATCAQVECWWRDRTAKETP